MLIHQYTRQWIKDFERIKIELDKALNDLDYTIEHVGSTSVPNLDAKPIIDIDIIHEDKAIFEAIKTRLEAIGYYHNGNQGIEDREVFKRKGEAENPILDIIRHHLYVCPSDSKALERHILFRNALRNNEVARLKYQTMKYEIAATTNQNKKAYAELKERTVNNFIDKLIGIKKPQPKL